MQKTKNIKIKQKRVPPDASVIVISRNRPKNLNNCLSALSENSFKNFEVIIVDQSNVPVPNSQLQEYTNNFTSFHYIFSKQTGKSRGLNKAIALSHATILAFTDDDCLPDKHWLKHIVESYSSHPEVSAVFGRTFSFEPDKHKGYFCPSTFENKNYNEHVITTPCKHWEFIGHGNNMSFRKTVFDELGKFKEWLGPGSPAKDGEDAEMIFRVLNAGKKLFYNPKSIIFHDRWLSLTENNQQDLAYLCGKVASYGYLSLAGNKIAKDILKESIDEVLNYKNPQLIAKIFTWLYGALVAIFYYYKEKYYAT